MNEGKQFEAIFLANIAPWAKFKEQVRKANFNPAEPRDDRSRWTRVDSQVASEPKIDQAQYRGFFHDIVVDDSLKGLASNDSTIMKNVAVLGINGILAIPDGASKPKKWAKPYFIEVKTGNDPSFTPNQIGSTLLYAWAAALHHSIQELKS